MKPSSREVRHTVEEVVVRSDEMPVVEAVTAAYQSGHLADTLFMQGRHDKGEDTYAFDMMYAGGMILSGLRQARAGRPARIDIFDLTDEQREQAGRMLDEYEAARDTGASVESS